MVPILEPSLARTQLSRTLNTDKGIDCTGLTCTLIIRNYDADKEPVYSGFDFGPYYGGTLDDAIQFQEIEIYDGSSKLENLTGSMSSALTYQFGLSNCFDGDITANQLCHTKPSTETGEPSMIYINLDNRKFDTIKIYNRIQYLVYSAGIIGAEIYILQGDASEKVWTDTFKLSRNDKTKPVGLFYFQPGSLESTPAPTLSGIDCTGLDCTLIIKNYNPDKLSRNSSYYEELSSYEYNDGIILSEIEIFDGLSKLENLTGSMSSDDNYGEGLSPCFDGFYWIIGGMDHWGTCKTKASTETGQPSMIYVNLNDRKFDAIEIYNTAGYFSKFNIIGAEIYILQGAGDASEKVWTDTFKISDNDKNKPVLLFNFQPGRVSMHPTLQPSSSPTKQPSSQPTKQPSSQPTKQPSSELSTVPTLQPSSELSIVMTRIVKLEKQVS
jgi:hypothetical protein